MTMEFSSGLSPANRRQTLDTNHVFTAVLCFFVTGALCSSTEWGLLNLSIFFYLIDPV